jgi:hypothetical protein
MQVGLNSDRAKDEMASFAQTYFSQFKRTPLGMIRQVWGTTMHICCTDVKIECGRTEMAYL